MRQWSSKLTENFFLYCIACSKQKLWTSHWCSHNAMIRIMECLKRRTELTQQGKCTASNTYVISSKLICETIGGRTYRIDSVDTSSSIQTGLAHTLVNIDFTMCTRKSRITSARVWIDFIGAVPTILTWARSALIDIEFAVFASVPVNALTSVCVFTRDTSTIVLARWRITRVVG